MRSIIFVSALCLQLQWSYGKPEGVGAFAYQDTSGNRYGGTYGLRDGQAFNFHNSDDASTFGPNPFTDFQDPESFFPEYFRNLENLIQEAFAKSAEHQKKALDAARKAFDLTSNRAGHIPNYDTGFDRFPGFPNYGFPQPSPNFNMPGSGSSFNYAPMSDFATNFGENSAFAGGAIAPGYRHQMVAINPTNPSMPNIDVTQFSEAAAPKGNGGFYSVQSSSYVSSSNINGKEASLKGGETIVNDNGKITKYSLHS